MPVNREKIGINQKVKVRKEIGIANGRLNVMRAILRCVLCKVGKQILIVQALPLLF